MFADSSEFRFFVCVVVWCNLRFWNFFLLLACFRKVGGVSSSDEILLVIKETLRYGLFLGTFAGTFTSVDEIVATLGGHRRQVNLST